MGNPVLCRSSPQQPQPPRGLRISLEGQTWIPHVLALARDGHSQHMQDRGQPVFWPKRWGGGLPGGGDTVKGVCSSPATFWSPVCSGQLSSAPLNDTPAHPLTSLCRRLTSALANPRIHVFISARLSAHPGACLRLVGRMVCSRHCWGMGVGVGCHRAIQRHGRAWVVREGQLVGGSWRPCAGGPRGGRLPSKRRGPFPLLVWTPHSPGEPGAPAQLLWDCGVPESAAVQHPLLVFLIKTEKPSGTMAAAGGSVTKRAEVRYPGQHRSPAPSQAS